MPQLLFTPQLEPGALCAQADPDAWFPEKGGTNRWAKKICGNCPLQDRCADYAIQHEELQGIWGGLSENQRDRIRRQQQRRSA